MLLENVGSLISKYLKLKQINQRKYIPAYHKYFYLCF